MLYLTDIDLNGNEIQNAVIQVLTADPSSGVLGQLYYNSSTSKLRIYTSSGWINVGGNLGYYTSAIATSSVAGVVKSGTDISVDSSGNVSVVNNSHTHTIANITNLSTQLSSLNSSISSNTTKITTLQNSLGAASGIATLDSSGKVPSSELPSYVDDVIEGYYYNSAFYSDSSHSTEITGETGKIYVDLSSLKTYRYSGSAFVVISETLALGETSSTAYRGDRGKTAYTHSQSAHAPSTAEKNIIISVQKNGTALTVDSNRAVNVTVPTTVSELTNDSGYLTAHPTISTKSISTASKTLSFGSTLTAISALSKDSNGHVTAATKTTYTLPSSPVPSNNAVSYKTTNPALTASGGVCTWQVTHSLNELYPIVQVYDTTTGEQVIVDVTHADANSVGITIASTSDISAGAYCVKVIA